MRNSAASRALEAVRGGGLDEVPKAITTPSYRAVAEDIIAIVRLVREGKIDYEEARLRMTGDKHLIQLLALEKMR